MTRFRLYIWYKDHTMALTQVVEAESYEEAEKMAIIDPLLELEFIEVNSLMDDHLTESEYSHVDEEEWMNEWKAIEEEEWNNPLSPL